MDPIATYRESRYERKCRFDLFSDSIRARGKYFMGDFDTEIPLTRLYPQFERVWVFGTLFVSAFWIILLSLVGLGVLIGAFNFGISDYRVQFAWGMLAIGLLMILINIRKIEMARFLSDAGVPTLVIARTNRQFEEYDQFIAMLVEQIKRVRGLV